MEPLMQNRTWNMKLAATDEFPETTLDGVSHDDALTIMRGLMYGPASREYERVEAIVRATSESRAVAA
jgi:hypothetical protein